MGNRLRVLWRAVARRTEAVRRLGPEHVCGKVAAAGEMSAAAYDDEHLPARVATDESSVATGVRG